MSESPSVSTRARTGLAALLAGALALAAITAGSAPAQAAEADGVSAGALTWGIKQSWRDYVKGVTVPPVGTISADGGAALVDPGDEVGSAYTWTPGAASYDPGAGSGSVRFDGDVHFLKPPHFAEIVVSDPIVEFSGGTATVSWSYSGSQGSGDVEDGATGTVTIGEPSVADGVATVAVSVTGLEFAIDGAMPFGTYGAGEPLDDLAFELSYAADEPVAPAATTTSIASIDPAGSAVEGTTVTVTPVVAPAVEGTIELFDGTASLGTRPAGTPFVLTGLAVGSHSLWAAFTPADPDAYEPSSSEASPVAYAITPAPPADVSVGTIAVAPPAPVELGTEIALSTTVTAGGEPVDSGSVEFLAVPSGGGAPVPLGTDASLVGGEAAITTTAVPAGGNTFRAVYTPGDGHVGAEAATTANYGVVDTSQPPTCTPGADALTSTGATASWGWSNYSTATSGPTAWGRFASGDIAISGTTFTLSGGAVTADADCAVIAFHGSIRIEAYQSFFPTHGQWIELVDPVLTVDRDGTGSWAADVRGGVGTYTGDEPTTHLALAGIAGVEGLPAPGASGEATVSLAYSGTTAAGTWSAGRGDAWSNGFVLAVPSAIRAFYYASGASGDANKAPLPLGVDFDWPAVSTTALAVAPAAPVTVGTEVTLAATVAPATAEGSVAFVAIPSGGAAEIPLGSAEVAGGVASLTTDALPGGGYTFRAEYTSSNGFAASTATRPGNYGVVDTAVPAVCEPGPDATRVYAVSASWDWSAYASGWAKAAGGSVTLDGQTFRLADGVATSDGDCTVVAFSGTLRTAAYASFFPPEGQWVELVDPVLTLDADGDGSWAADVRSGVGTRTGAEPTAHRTIATITGADPLDLSAVGASTTITPDYAGTTASGTWSAGRDSAWSNGFVLAVPSAIRAFYYASGASNDGQKPPAPITVTRAAPLATTTTLGASATTLPAGGTVVLTATVSPAVPGTVTFTDGEAVVAAVAAADGTASITASPAAGGHSYRASFAPANAQRHGASASAVVTVEVDAPPAPPALASGLLSWGVRDSFVRYIVGPIANGSIAVAGGAGYSGGLFQFPQADGGDFDRASGTGTAVYRGSVSFSGHGGLLALTIADPRITIAGDGSGALSVVAGGSRIAFAALDFGGATRSADASGAITWTGVAATLTPDGSALFAYGGSTFYPAGTALSPLTFTIGAPNAASLGGGTVAAAAETRTPAPTPPATSGLTIVGGAPVAGGTVTITAAGFHPGEEGILVVIYSDPVLLGTTSADASGVATWTGRLPQGLTGTHTLTLQGSVSRGAVVTIASAPAATPGSCTVDDATLTWGFKESFRGYITSTIANGRWDVAGGASYATPAFSWSGSGTLDPDGAVGDLAFTGSVRFTGHDGALDTTIANPRIVLAEDGTGVLLLDVTGTTMDGVAVASTGIEFARLDLSAAAAESANGALTWTEVPAALTAAGAAAFGTYREGEALDPVTFTAELPEGCAEGAPEPTATPFAAAVDTGGAAPADLSWIWWLVGGLVVLAAAATTVVLIRRRAS